MNSELSLLGKVSLYHASTGREGRFRYSTNPLAASMLERCEQSAPRPGRFTPGKEPLSIVQEAG